MNKIVKHALIMASIMLLSACGSNNQQSLYHWGDYSKTIYDYYHDDGAFDKQEQALLKIIDQAKQINKPVGPGVYGQLGLIYYKEGKMAEATAAWQQERTLYPESSALIQFLQNKK